VTSTSEGKRDALSGYVSVLAPVIIVSAWKAVTKLNLFVTSRPLEIL
jgi:hypothetical protein